MISYNALDLDELDRYEKMNQRYESSVEVMVLNYILDTLCHKFQIQFRIFYN